MSITEQITETAFPLGPEVERDRWGRPLIKQPDSSRVAYTRATTVAGTTDKTYRLAEWQQRMVAVGLAARQDLLLGAISLGQPPAKGSSHEKDWKEQMMIIVEAAMEAAKANAPATAGTAWHKLVERGDRGQEIGPLPPEYAPALAAYLEATARLEAVHIEQMMVDDERKVAGTPDRVVRLEGVDGCFIADLKTGTVADYTAGKMAIQLALYSRMRGYDVATGQRFDVPGLNQRAGIIIDLDPAAATCRLLWINLAAGWEGAELAFQVRDWQGRGSSLLVPFS